MHRSGAAANVSAQSGEQNARERPFQCLTAMTSDGWRRISQTGSRSGEIEQRGLD
jgi:hypothetical protein